VAGAGASGVNAVAAEATAAPANIVRRLSSVMCLSPWIDK
jgi:hypothetical protein